MTKDYFWALITLIIAIILAIILLSVARDDSPQSEEQIYSGIALDPHLIAVDKEALEAAYKDHLKLLFSTWLKDDVTVVHRINEGLRRARHAYSAASAKIEERQRQIQERGK